MNAYTKGDSPPPPPANKSWAIAVQSIAGMLSTETAEKGAYFPLICAFQWR